MTTPSALIRSSLSTVATVLEQVNGAVELKASKVDTGLLRTDVNNMRSRLVASEHKVEVMDAALEELAKLVDKQKVEHESYKRRLDAAEKELADVRAAKVKRQRPAAVVIADDDDEDDPDYTGSSSDTEQVHERPQPFDRHYNPIACQHQVMNSHGEKVTRSFLDKVKAAWRDLKCHPGKLVGTEQSHDELVRAFKAAGFRWECLASCPHH